MASPSNSPFSIAGASISGGSLVFLGSQTASSSPSLAFINLFSSNYSQYLFVFNGVLPATTGTLLYAQLGTGPTPTYVTANYNWQTSNVVNTTSLNTANQSDVQAILTDGTNTVYNVGAGINGELFLFGTNASSAIASANQELVYLSTGGTNTYLSTNKGVWQQPAALFTAIKFYFNTGNIASGTISMYGIAQSGGNAGQFGVKAWVTFNTMGGTLTITGSSNNITGVYNSTGNVTWTFPSGLFGTQIGCSGSCGTGSPAAYFIAPGLGSGSSLTSFVTQTVGSTGAAAEPPYASALFYGA